MAWRILRLVIFDNFHDRRGGEGSDVDVDITVSLGFFWPEIQAFQVSGFQQLAQAAPSSST